MSPLPNPNQGQPRKVLIIGAGIYALVAAKTYLQINPEIDLTLLDSDSTVGGVWSASRAYPGLVADLPAPIYEFSDLSMCDEFNIPKWGDISGQVFHQYLVRYAAKFDVLRRCKLNTEVLDVERDGKGWRVRMRGVGDSSGREEIMKCDVLIVATGNFSKPSIPDIDTSVFDGLVLHMKDFNKRYHEIASDKVQTVVVVGGNKSSVEAVGACTRAGKQVYWVIRKDGAGPGMLLNSRLPNGRSNIELSLTRFFTLNNHTIFGTRGWWDRFVLSGHYKLGTRFFNWFWTKMTAQQIKGRYDKSENGRLLKPKIENLFWSASGISVAHDLELKLMDTINEGKLVHVARAAIQSMNGKTIRLSDGATVETDALIFATGWKLSSTEIFKPSLRAELGLPTPLDQYPPADSAYWKSLDSAADAEILKIYPLFSNPHKEIPVRECSDTRFRLFRTIIPPKLAVKNDRSIVFLGNLANAQQATYAEVSTLWSIAYLEGLLPDMIVGNQETMDKEIALTNAFSMRRYAGRGGNRPNALLDIRDWNDLLMRDLGLRTDRKRLSYERSSDSGWGWWGLKAWKKEWFEPYVPQDYRGIVADFIEKANRDSEARKTK